MRAINEEITGTEFQDELKGNLPPAKTRVQDTTPANPIPAQDSENTPASFEGITNNSTAEEEPGTIGFFFADEFAAYQVPTKKKKLSKRGQTPVVESRGGRKHQNVIGLLSLFAATVLSMFVDVMNGTVFIGFLKALLRYYGHLQKIYLIIDNAPAHRAKIVDKFLKSVKDKLEVIFLPPYSPKLNPIEHFWTYVRDWVTHDHFHPKFEDLVETLRSFLVKHKTFNAEVLSRCCYY